MERIKLLEININELNCEIELKSKSFDEVHNKFVIVTKEHEDLKEKHAQLNSNFEISKAIYSTSECSLKSEISRLEGEILSKSSDIKLLDKQLIDTKKLVAEKSQEVYNQLDERDSIINELKWSNQQNLVVLHQNENQMNIQSSEISTLKSEVLTLKGKLVAASQVQLNLESANHSLMLKENEITIKNSKIDQLQSDLSLKDSEIEKSSKLIEELKNAGRKAKEIFKGKHQS